MKSIIGNLKYIPVLILLVIFSACKNNEETPGMLPTEGTIKKLEQKSAYKEEVILVESIMRKLVDARGIPLPKGTPKVFVDNEAIGNSPAAASPKHNYLIINSKTIQIARNFGQDSLDVLAAIIGHELVHLYQQGECSFTYRPTSTDSLEQEADWQGLFNAYVAGYKIKGEQDATLQSRLIDSIYVNFKLPKNLPAYPTLKERKDMAALTDTKVLELRLLYETANYALLRGSFLIAIECYKHLLSNVETKELNHNLGIAYASYYKQMNGDNFTYPFELNTDFRLYAKVRAEAKDVKAAKTLALFHFRKGGNNIKELNLFETSLAIIGGDYALAKEKLKKIPKGKYETRFLTLKKTMQTKKLGYSAYHPKRKIAKTADPCGFQPEYLDEINPTTPLANGLLYHLDFKKDISAVKYGDNRFALQIYQPDCLDIEALDADFVVNHSKGKFHIFTGESMIFKEIDGRIVEVVWVYPRFPE